jgi:hypothetical protein
MCRDDEVTVWLFGQDVQLEIPVARVTPHGPTSWIVDRETGEVLQDETPPAALVAWQPAPPAAGSAARRLFAHLSLHGLLLEPFERAEVGLREVYGQLASRSAG